MESRPWGMFEVLLNNRAHKVKLITVSPKQRLSLQSHEHRSEAWTCIRGIATLSDGETDTDFTVGETVHIKQGDKHRLWNKTDGIIQIIEVQTGTYFGEDDIIRYEDDYARV